MTELTEAQKKREAIYQEACEHLLMFNGVKEMPKMGNYTPARLVDMVGSIKKIEADAKKTINMLNGVIDSKLTPEELRGEGGVTGERYKMTISPVTQVRLSTDRARNLIIQLVQQLNADLPESERTKKVQDALDSVHDTIDMSQHRYGDL